MEGNWTRWRDTIRSWLFHLGYVLAVDEIISSVERRMVEWKFDLDAMEAELQRTGRMDRHQKRASWDALRFELWLDPIDSREERGRKTVSLQFDPAAAEVNADPALQQQQESLEEHLAAAMEKLPRRLRLLVIKRAYKRTTFRELAEESGMSVGHIHGQYRMAIAMLGRAIDEARRKKLRA